MIPLIGTGLLLVRCLSNYIKGPEERRQNNFSKSIDESP